MRRPNDSQRILRRRARILRRLEAGESPAEVALAVGVALRTVYAVRSWARTEPARQHAAG
jgi:hypothetical protein